MTKEQIELNRLMVAVGRKGKEIMDEFYDALFSDSETSECVFTKYNTKWVYFTEEWNNKHPYFKIDPLDFYRHAIDQKI